MPAAPGLLEAMTTLSQHEEFVREFLADRTLLWLGSAISRERFPTLLQLLGQLLDDLQAKRHASQPYEAAFQLIIGMSRVQCDHAHLTSAQKDDIAYQLVDRYAK